jgi:hypothetical protein
MPEFLAETYAPRGAAPHAGEAALAAEQVSRPGAPVRFLGAVDPHSPSGDHASPPR